MSDFQLQRHGVLALTPDPDISSSSPGGGGMGSPDNGSGGQPVLIGIALAVLLLALALFSNGDGEPFLLAVLAVLAMVGVFFLFGLTAGLIRIGTKQSKAHFARAAVDALDDAIHITTPDGGTIYANKAYRALVGTSNAGQPGTLEDLFAGEPNASEAVFRLSRAAEQGLAAYEEFRVRGVNTPANAYVPNITPSTDHVNAQLDQPARTPPVNRSRQAKWYRLAVRPLHNQFHDDQAATSLATSSICSQAAQMGSGSAGDISAQGGSLVAWQLVDITNAHAHQAEATNLLAAQLKSFDGLPVGLLTVAASGHIEQMNQPLSGWLGVQTAATTDSATISLTDITNEHDFTSLMQALNSLDTISATDGAARTDTTVKLDTDFIDVQGQTLPVTLLVNNSPRIGPLRQSITCVVLRRHQMECGETKINAAPSAPHLNGDPASNASSHNSADADAADHRLAKFYQTAPIGIATVNSAGKIISSNDSFMRMFRAEGASRKNTIARLLARNGDAEARKALLDALGDVVAKKSSSAPIEILFGAKSEQSRRVDMTYIGGETSNEACAILYVVDTTEQRALELQFAQSQKMEAVGKLAGGIAHDFNNVLTVILGLSDLFLQTRRATDHGYNDIMQIRSNANRAAGMVRQLLAFSRKQTLAPVVLGLNDVVQDLGYTLRRLLGERVDLKMRCQRDLWLVKADQTQLEQVLINLAVNARDAMPDGGRLSIRTKNITARQSVKLAEQGVAAGDYVMIEVKDTGTGMDQTVVEQIFEPFYSTKDVGKGTGLGLSTVHGIVNQTGGYIIPESKLGKGTTFKVYLPRHQGEPNETLTDGTATSNTSKSGDSTGTGCVLLVEDEDGVRSFATRALQRQGYKVLEAASGVEALEVMAQNDGRVDIVVSDVVMPEMDGPSLLKELRQTHPNMKFIFMSGYPDDAFSNGLDPNETYAFLAKPFTLALLADKVKEELHK